MTARLAAGNQRWERLVMPGGPHVEKMTTLAVSLGRLLIARSHLCAALRTWAFRALTHIPGIRHAVLQGRYRPPARYKHGLLVGSFPRRSSVGRLFPQPDVRTFDGELQRLDDTTGTGRRIMGWEIDPSTALSLRGRHLAQDVLRAKLVTLCGPGRRPVETGASRDVLQDMHGVARPLSGRRPFVVIRPDGYVYANPTRQERRDDWRAGSPNSKCCCRFAPVSYDARQALDHHKNDAERKLKAAVVKALGTEPVYADFPDPQDRDGAVVATVEAAALRNLDRVMVSGKHYSSAHLPLPMVAGVDGVARLDDGRLVYANAQPPYGMMAEKTLGDECHCGRPTFKPGADPKSGRPGRSVRYQHGDRRSTADRRYRLEHITDESSETIRNTG